MYVKCRVAVTKVLLNCASIAASTDKTHPHTIDTFVQLLIENNQDEEQQHYHRIEKRGVFRQNRFNNNSRKRHRLVTQKCLNEIDQQMMNSIDDRILVELQQRSSFEFLNCLNTSSLDSSIAQDDQVLCCST